MPISPFTNPSATLAIILVGLGLVGAVVPVVPGPPLIWLGAFVWGAGENFRQMDWLTLGILGVLAIVATFSDIWLGRLTQKREGFGWRNVIAAVIGGLIGGIALSGVPILGTLLGASVGSLLAVGGITYWHSRKFGTAARAARAYLVGCALSAAIEVSFSLLMVAIMLWRILSTPFRF